MSGVGGDAKKLLKQWQEQPKQAIFPQRPLLMYHLANIGMQDLHTKSVLRIVACKIIMCTLLCRLMCSEISTKGVRESEIWKNRHAEISRELEKLK